MRSSPPTSLRIGLQELRSCLGIVSQEPVLFSGSLKENLDPFGQFETAESAPWGACGVGGLCSPKAAGQVAAKMLTLWVMPFSVASLLRSALRLLELMNDVGLDAVGWGGSDS